MPLAEYNDYTRMSRAQLADRIRQMQATADRNSQLGAPNERHRPMEDRRRREKIALYQEQLDRLNRFDEIERQRQEREEAAIPQQPTPNARSIHDQTADEYARSVACPTCGADKGSPCRRPSGHNTFGGEPHARRVQAAADARTAADLESFTKKLQAQADARVCQWCEGTGTVLLLEGKNTTSRRCTACHGTGKHDPTTAKERADAELDAQLCDEHDHPEEAMRYTDTPVSHDGLASTRADDAERRHRAAERAEETAEPLELPHRPAPTPVAQAPVRDAIEEARRKLEARLSIECPQCHAQPGQRCRNYKGDHCHPHGARKLPQQADADRRSAKHAAADATAARRATVAAIRKTTTPDAPAADPRPQPSPKPPADPPRPEPTPEKHDTDNGLPVGRGGAPRPKLSAFDLAVEALVRDHTLPSVLDAAWAASKRLFNPIGGAR